VAVTAPHAPAPGRALTFEELEDVFRDVPAPFALVDLDALWANAREMLARAGGTPVRVATKSVRCREIVRDVLEHEPGFRGLMTFTLGESLWLFEHGFRDILLAYPTADREGLARLARIEEEGRPVVMVDSPAHLDLIDAAAGTPRAAPVRVCIELDLSWWPAGGRIKVGAKRSPVRTPGAARALAAEIVRRPGFELAGVMGYEAHIAGLGDRPLGAPWQERGIRWMKQRSVAEIAERRAAVVAAVREVAPLDFVNGGGTGSLHTTAREPAVTEVTAGSGLYAPTLFDRYSDFTLTPAAMFALPVVRRPSGGVATLLGGGYHASGPPGRDRLPSPHRPEGLRLDAREGAGEVQTPVIGAAAASLRLGDRVYLRHAKAGELCERFDRLYLVSRGRIVGEEPTYRGEGRCEL
jgi:D-serine deaminase-like pyridoxal phosphate-dependent protein